MGGSSCTDPTCTECTDESCCTDPSCYCTDPSDPLCCIGDSGDPVPECTDPSCCTDDSCTECTGDSCDPEPECTNEPKPAYCISGYNNPDTCEYVCTQQCTNKPKPSNCAYGHNNADCSFTCDKENDPKPDGCLDGYNDTDGSYICTEEEDTTPTADEDWDVCATSPCSNGGSNNIKYCLKLSKTGLGPEEVVGAGYCNFSDNEDCTADYHGDFCSAYYSCEGNNMQGYCD